MFIFLLIIKGNEDVFAVVLIATDSQLRKRGITGFWSNSCPYTNLSVSHLHKNFIDSDIKRKKKQVKVDLLSGMKNIYGGENNYLEKSTLYS